MFKERRVSLHCQLQCVSQGHSFQVSTTRFLQSLKRADLRLQTNKLSAITLPYPSVECVPELCSSLRSVLLCVIVCVQYCCHTNLRS